MGTNIGTRKTPCGMPSCVGIETLHLARIIDPFLSRSQVDAAWVLQRRWASSELDGRIEMDRGQSRHGNPGHFPVGDEDAMRLLIGSCPCRSFAESLRAGCR